MMNNLQKQAVNSTFNAHTEYWGALPVIVNGKDSYNFYHAMMAQEFNLNQR